MILFNPDVTESVVERMPKPDDLAEAEDFPEPEFLEGRAPQSNERTLAMLAHLGGLFFSFLIPAYLMMTQQDKSHFVVRHAREAVNYQLTLFFHAFVLLLPMIGIAALFHYAFDKWHWGVLAGSALSLMASFVLIGVEIWFIVRACSAATQGKEFRYPLTIRLI